MEKEGRPPENKRSRKPAHPVKREINEEMKVCLGFGAGEAELFLPPAPLGPRCGFGGAGARLSVSVGCPERLGRSSRCRAEANSRAASSGFADLRFDGGGGGRGTTDRLTVSAPGRCRRAVGGGGRRPERRRARPRGFPSRRCSLLRFSIPSKVGSCRAEAPGSARFPRLPGSSPRRATPLPPKWPAVRRQGAVSARGSRGPGGAGLGTVLTCGSPRPPLPAPLPPAPLHASLPREAAAGQPRWKRAVAGAACGEPLPIVRPGQPRVRSARPGSPPGQRCSRGGGRSRLVLQLFPSERWHQSEHRSASRPSSAPPTPLFSRKLQLLPGEGFIP